MRVWRKGGVSSAESVGKVVSAVQRVVSEVPGRLMHERVWKRSHCYEVLEVRFRFKLDEKEERWHGCKLIVESRS